MYSADSVLEPEKIIALAKKRGFNGIAITDHVSAKGGFAGARANRDPHFTVIPGIEYATEVGHVLGLFIAREPDLGDYLAPFASRKKSPVLPLKPVVQAIHAEGGIAVLAHPFESTRDLPGGLFRQERESNGALKEDFLDALEAHNARACTRRNLDANKKARDYARNLGIPTTGGSDAHMAWEVGRAGCVIDSLQPGASLDDIKKAILSGQARPFGLESPMVVVPLTLLIKMRKSGRYGDAPRILGQLAVASLGRPGVWLENLIKGRPRG